MKKLFIASVPFATTIVMTMIGFLSHYQSETKVAKYIESYEHGIELGLYWGIFIALCFMPLSFLSTELKKTSWVIVSVGMLCVGLSLLSYFITPYFYLLSQIA